MGNGRNPLENRGFFRFLCSTAFWELNIINRFSVEVNVALDQWLESSRTRRHRPFS
jgi:hypothetical protein